MENIEKREKLCKNMEEQGKTSGKHFKKPWDVWENVGRAGRKTVIRFGKVLINFEKPLVNNYSSAETPDVVKTNRVWSPIYNTYETFYCGRKKGYYRSTSTSTFYSVGKTV